MAEGGTQTSCESCRMYQQEIRILLDKILALETEKGLHDTLPMDHSGKETGTTSNHLKLNDTITFPKLHRQLGARPKQRQNAVKNVTGIKLTNRFSPLSESEHYEQRQLERNRDHEVKTKRERNTVQSVKAKDILLLGDGAISNINMDRMITSSYPSATISDITDVLKKEIGNNPGIKQIVLHVGAVDIRNEESEILKENFNKLFETLNCLDKETIQFFISGPIPSIDGRINKFSRLFQLNSWLSKVCESRGLCFIENFDLFWKRGDLFKGKGPHLSRGGVRRLTENLLHALENQRRPELQERAERSERRAPSSSAKVSPAKDSVAAASSAPSVMDSAAVKDPASAAPSAPTVNDSATVKDPVSAAPSAPASSGRNSAAAPPASTENDTATGALPSTPPRACTPPRASPSTPLQASTPPQLSTPPQGWNPTAISTPSRDSSESFPSPESPMRLPTHFESLVKLGIKMTPLTPVMSRPKPLSPKRNRAPPPPQPFSPTKASPARPPPPKPTAVISSSVTAAV